MILFFIILIIIVGPSWKFVQQLLVNRRIPGIPLCSALPKLLLVIIIIIIIVVVIILLIVIIIIK